MDDERCALAQPRVARRPRAADRARPHPRRFDGMFISVAQQAGGIDNLLDTFFGFLRRKTDFFAGAADPEAAKNSVLKGFQKNKDRADEEIKEKQVKEKKRKAEEEARRCAP